jgi:GT2 family glycosyltransferase
MEISVIIVTYNSAGCITRCLESILKQRDLKFEVVVVDNASSDTTISLVKNYPVKLVESKDNLGFGSGCNLGFSYCSGKLVYIFNPDAWLEAEDALTVICRAFEQNKIWGMAGTTVLNSSNDHESKPSEEYPGQTSAHGDLSQLPGKIAWVIGASMIIRRELFERLGGFDEAFFLYSEETDFCLRLRKLGYEVGHLTSVVARHIGGASEDRQDPYLRAMRKNKSMILFRSKHYTKDHCLRLARKDLRYARWHFLINSLLTMVQQKYSPAWRKKRRYQAIMETSRDFLSNSNV